MRQIATLPDADAARTFADHLLTLKIETRLENEPGGWAVWVCDEDRVPQAREELAAFTREPHAPRFAAARRAAAQVRKDEVRKDEEAAARQVDLTGRQTGPKMPVWTFGLIAGCILTFAGHAAYVVHDNPQLGLLGALGAGLYLTDDHQHVTSPVEQALMIAPFEMKEGEKKWRPLYVLGGRAWLAEPWRLATPIFLHFGPLHLLFNLVMLAQLGGMMELRRGAWRYLLFVLTCAVASNLCQFYLGHPTWDGGVRLEPSPMFGGMSGVVYGLFGYVWTKGRFAPELGLGVGPRTAVILLVWFVLCFTGVFGPIANAAHAAGLVFGAAVGIVPHLGRLLRRR
jgi:GlpG protein